MSRAENIRFRFVLGYVIDNDVPVQVVPACKELDALEAERDRYREALEKITSEAPSPHRVEGFGQDAELAAQLGSIAREALRK